MNENSANNRPVDQIRIEISDNGLVAKAVVDASERSPDTNRPPGQQIDADALRHAARQAGVTYGIRGTELDEDWKAARSAADDGPVTVEVAHGDTPTPPTAAKFSAAEGLSLPDELEERAPALTRAAGSPRLFREIRKETTVRRKVDKKTSFPFVGAKEEWVEVPETSVEHERVYVDTHVEQRLYVEAGQLVGTIQPATPGKAGRSVTGDELAATPLGDPDFYLGDYAGREGHRVVAELSGFVRLGTNWLDIVPYDNHSWSVEVDASGRMCTLSYRPGDEPSGKPDARDVVDTATGQGIDPKALQPTDEIQRRIDDSCEKKRPLDAVSIMNDSDAEVSLTVTPDRLKALLTVRKARGNGRPLRLKDIGQRIAEAGLAAIDKERIRTDLTTFATGNEAELVDYVVAEGTPPGRGPDPVVDFSLRYLDEDAQAQIADRLKHATADATPASNLADFPPESIEQLAPVDEEQRILTIAPALPGKPGKDVYGESIPGESGEEPELRLSGLIERRENFIIATADGLLDKRREGNTIFLRVQPHRDVVLSVKRADDKMTAFLHVTPHLGTGRPLDTSLIDTILEENGITDGVLESGIEAALECDARGDAAESILIARGTPAIRAGVPSVQLLIELPDAQDLESGLDRTLRLGSVGSNQPIAEIIRSPAESHEGKTVTGEEIAAATVEPQVLHGGENTKITAEDAHRSTLVATADGELVIRSDTAHVLVDFRVSGDVDAESGNINFPGPVTISGSVRSGRVVMAGGDVAVAKTVEAALVSSNGSISISGGVKGGGKGVLRAKGNLNTSFLEQTRVLVVGTLELDSGTLQCTIKCNDEIKCSGAKSRITGGSIRSKKGLTVGSLGSESGTRTVVSFGQDYLVEDQIEQLERAIAKARKRVERLDREAEQLTGAKLTALRAEKVKQLKAIEARGMKLFILREKFETHIESAVIVRGTLYQGVVFECHGRRQEVKQAQTAVRVVFDPEAGRINTQPLQKTRSS